MVGSLVVPLLGAVSWEQHDVAGAGDGLHDLDIRCSDGSVIAVEVTRITDRVRRRQTRSRSDYVPETGGVSRRWVLCATRYDVDFKRLHGNVDPLLARLERMGATEFDRSTFHGLSGYAEAVKRVQAFGFMEGDSEVPEPGESGAVLVCDVVVTMTGSESFARVVQECIDANATKLSSTGRLASILVIWVDSQTWAGQAPMSHAAFMPTEAPTLPPACNGIIVFREEFPFQPRADRAWTYGQVNGGLLRPGWSDVTDCL